MTPLYKPKFGEQTTVPGQTFRRIQEIMAQPLSDEEIEQFYHQEPLNQSPQLPAEEQLDPNQLHLNYNEH